MALTQLTTNLNYHQALGNQPNSDDGLTANVIKARYDQAANDIKTYLNSTLLAELAAVTDGDSGADNIAATAITGLSGTTVQALLESVNSKVTAINPVGGYYVVTDPTYGAVGNGTTDDTAAIQAAIAAANTAGGGTVYFPPGTYVVSASLTLYANVKLIGHKATIFLKNASNVSAFVSTSVSNITIEDLKIDANYANQTSSVYGIALTGGSGHKIHRVEVQNADYGIAVIDAQNYSISKCKVHDITYYGISVFADSADSSGFQILDNIAYNCKSSDTPGAGVDGSGINIKGKSDVSPKKYMKNGVVKGNICYSNGKHGIMVICGDSINIDDNVCYSHILNTDTGSGICISEACIHINIGGNTSHSNYHAGILLDVATAVAGDSINYGWMNVVGNTVYNNTVAGIKNNNVPKVNITSNQIKGGLWGVFFNQNCQLSTISHNEIEDCTQNGIRMIGNAGPAAGAQENVNVHGNRIENCATEVGGTLVGLYIEYFTNVIASDNIFKNNGKDMLIGDNASAIYLLNNRFTSVITINLGGSILKWEDCKTESSFLTTQFTGESKSYITLADTFTIQHFGREMVQLNASAPRISSLTTAIQSGYMGQRLVLMNINTPTITIKHNANTKNIGSVDVVLSYGQVVTYIFSAGNGWIQTAAAVSTGL